jgi:hypothetical protein
MGIGIGYVGFDIVDGSAIDEVCSLYVYHWGIRGIVVDVVYLDGRQPDGIGTIGTS